MACFAARRNGGLGPSGVSLLMCRPLLLCQLRAKYGRCKNKRPVELLGSPYYKGVPVPRIRSVHKLGTKSRIAQRSEHATVDPQGTYSHAGRSTSEPRRQYSRSRGTAQHASTTKIPRNRAVLSAARCTNGIIRQSNARRVTLKSQAPVKQ